MPTSHPVHAPALTLDGVATPVSGLRFDAAASRGFTDGAYRAELSVDVRDLAGLDSALQSGFGYEGRRRAAALVDGVRHDLAVFARTAGDPGTPVAPAFPAIAEGSLTDGVIALREAGPDDAGSVWELETDAVSVAVSVHGAPDRAALERMLAAAPLERRVGPGALFAIVDVATGRCAGTIRLRRNGPPGVGMFGYAVHPAFRGRAYTTRALRLLTPWALSEAGFARLELGAKTDNIASQRAALAAGFLPDGVMRARLRNPDGSYSDEARFYLLRDVEPGSTAF